MQDEFDKHFPSLRVSIVAINEKGQESSNALAVADRNLPLLQDVDSNGDGASDVWASWDAAWRDVRILDKENNLRTDPAPNEPVVNLTTRNLGVPENYNYLKSRLIAAADRVQATPWQAPVEPLDVNNNGTLAPIDALLVINRLGLYPNGTLPPLSGGQTPDAYVDVNGNGIVAPIDALLVINQLSRNSSSANGRAVDADTLNDEDAPDRQAPPSVMSWGAAQPVAPLTTRAPRGINGQWIDAVFAEET